MTTERNLRRVDRVETRRSRLPPRSTELRRDSDEAFAVTNLVMLAKDLAGIAEPVFWAAEKEKEEREAEIARQMAESRAWREQRTGQAAPADERGVASTEPRPRWTKTRRPGPFDLLTWEEAMQVPWIEGSEACDLGNDED